MVWREIDKIQTTTRPDHAWPEVRTKIGKAAQNREKQEWAKKKPKLDNARRLRGIFFIDLEEQNCKETLKQMQGENWKDLRHPSCKEKKRKKLQMASRKCLHKRRLHPRRLQNNHGRIVESHESTKQRVESFQPENHEDHKAGKGFTSMTHCNLAHKFIPMHQSDEKSGCKSCSG